MQEREVNNGTLNGAAAVVGMLEHEIHRVAMQDASPDLAASSAGYWKKWHQAVCSRVLSPRWLSICEKSGVTRAVLERSKGDSVCRVCRKRARMKRRKLR